MRMTAEQVLQLEQLRAGRCPLHIKHNPNCSICLNLEFHQKQNSEEFPIADAVELEAPLQEEIEREARRRGWVCIRTRMDCRNTFTMLGVCDLIIAADYGRVFWIETKRKNAKQTTEQIGFQMLLSRNGHVYHLVRSMREALNIFGKP